MPCSRAAAVIRLDSITVALLELGHANGPAFLSFGPSIESGLTEQNGSFRQPATVHEVRDWP